LIRLYKEGLITEEMALSQADQPGDLKIRIQQIKLGEGGAKEVLRSINTSGLKISDDR
jgi:twitching motility protein PilU